MAQPERHQEIQELVRRQGFVSIEALAQHFAVTPQTIRRDINSLNRQGLVRRYHGGAGLPSSVENVAYATRQVTRLAEKRRIAALLAEQIPDEASLFLNIGTTTEEVARALRGKRGLRVITNNLNVAAILAESETAEVTVVGGLMRKRDRAVIGEAAIEFIRQFKVDYGVIGISAIDPDGTLLDFDYREVQVSKAIIASARRVFLAADHTKFSRNALVRLGDLSLIDAFFTDQPLAPGVAGRFAEAEVAVHVAATPRSAPERRSAGETPVAL